MKIVKLIAVMSVMGVNSVLAQGLDVLPAEEEPINPLQIEMQKRAQEKAEKEAKKKS